MPHLHLIVGVSALALTSLTTVVGAAVWFKGLIDHAKPFWLLLRTTQVVLAVQLLLGVILLISGRVPATDLHIVYGSLPVAVMFIAEQLRAAAAEQILQTKGFDTSQSLRSQLEERHPDSPEKSEKLANALVATILRREVAVLTAASLVCVFLVLRAAQIGGVTF